MIKVLILGSKEYPFGTNKCDDPIPSVGMERYVDDLAPELSKLCKLTIITRMFKGTKKYQKIGKNIDVFRVRWLKGGKTGWIRNPSFNFFSFMCGLNVARNADIIYSNAFASGFFGFVLGRLFGKPSVYRPAGLGIRTYTGWRWWVSKIFEPIVFQCSTAVVFHSEGEKRNAQKHFKIKLPYVIMTGFPVDKFRNGKKRKSEFGIKNETVITTVCRFVPVKGLEYLLEACSRLDGSFKLLMVGSGPEEKRLRKLSKELGIKDKVFFTGFRSDIPDILATTDIFVVSSRSEGLPTSLLEAMAAGNACVVTNIGLPVKHMDTGMVVEPKNSFALKNDIQALMRDKKLRKRIGENACRFVLENCTQRKAAKSHMHVFRKLLENK